ncbi:MAG: hypothetical protein IKI69_07145 [Oscillospiraceae bacterium]|nr:hypothetical protein [Oscillospiraceae bacterium]
MKEKIKIILIVVSVLLAYVGLIVLNYYILPNRPSQFEYTITPKRITPKRLQSLWLICVLACGCICAIVHLITEKKVFRTWMFFSAISLAVLSFY